MANPKSNRTRKKKSQDEIRQSVTDTLLRLMDDGDLPPWRKGFTPANVNYAGPSLPHNLSTQRGYGGINFLLLMAQSQVKEYSTNAWATFKQIKSLGGGVNKGERGVRVVFFDALLKNTETGEVLKLNKMTTDEIDALDKSSIVRIPFMREFVVFNADQTNGLESILGLGTEHALKEVPSDERFARDKAVVEAFIEHLESTGLTINFVPQIKTATYQLGSHVIRMAPMEQYETLPRFLSTLAHEAGHSTMRALERPCAVEGMTDENRIREEMIAEITAAMTVAQLGLAFDAGNSACYIDAWRQRDAMAGDPNLILEVSREASKAVNLLLPESFMRKVAAIDARYGINQVADEAEENQPVIPEPDSDPLNGFDLNAAIETASKMLTNFQISDSDAIDQALALAKAQAMPSTGVIHANSENEIAVAATEVADEDSPAFEPETLLKIAADDVSKLRAIDVFRLLDEAAEVSSEQSQSGSPVKDMADYICRHRGDLIEEVQEVMKDELGVEYQFSASQVNVDAESGVTAAVEDDDPFVAQARSESLSNFMS